METKLTFEQWMRRVDQILSNRYMGITSEDLPDQCYTDWYDDCDTPMQAARRAVKNSDSDE